MYKMHQIFVLSITIILWFCCISTAANYPLEIIQPQEKLDIKNRFYKAFPGLEYNVRITAIGGMYPNTYELLTAPSGMIINSDTGVISWPGPVESGSPHNVGVRVTDYEGHVDIHNWTITVTTNGFRFLDAINGKTVAQGGTGSIDKPWKSLSDMYENDKNASSYTGEFLYFRDGTYTIDTPLEDGTRMAMVGQKKPLVWLAYPSESPVLNLGIGYIVIYGGGDNLYIEGLEILNISNSKAEGWRVASGADNVTFRKNNFHGLVDQGVTNQACVFISNEGTGLYWSFTENLFHDVVSGNGVEAYKAEKVLVEDNTFYDFRAGTRPGHALAPKMSYRYWFIRNNLFYDCDTWSIWADGYTNSGPTEHIDISFNLVRTEGTYAFQANYDDGEQGATYVYRNTFVGPVDVRFAETGRGPYNFYNNVIINDTNGVSCTSCSDSSIIVESDNLEGVTNDNIIDVNGDLTENYSKYIGVYGYQISGQRSAPPYAPPQAPNDFKQFSKF